MMEASSSPDMLEQAKVPFYYRPSPCAEDVALPPVRVETFRTQDRNKEVSITLSHVFLSYVVKDVVSALFPLLAFLLLFFFRSPLGHWGRDSDADVASRQLSERVGEGKQTVRGVLSAGLENEAASSVHAGFYHEFARASAVVGWLHQCAAVGPR